MINTMERKKCTGCGACLNICPNKCIGMVKDEKGFLYPAIDETKCIKCGKCKEVCPSLHKIEKTKNYVHPNVYAAWSLNEDIRWESTSGGIFSELALEILKNQGIVCGAKYNENHLVEHCIIESDENLSEIRQSKYVQSDTKMVFSEIKVYLEAGREVLFCGTPCECAGLFSFLGKEYDNLIYVDFICRGSNSPKVYSMFLQELEKQYGGKVKRVWFKNKANGWRKFITRIEFENGKVYAENRYSDSYIRGFIEANLYMRDCCEECQYKQMPRISDITLGDFWGIRSVDVGAETDYGTSLVMINSIKGEALYERIKPNIFSTLRSFEEACKGNMCILESPKFNAKCADFWNKIDEINIIENINRFCK